MLTLPPLTTRGGDWFFDSWNRAKHAVMVLVFIVVAQIAGLGASLALAGCHDPSPTQDPAAYQHQQEIKAESTYTGDLMACTAKAKTLAESERCEDLIDIKWGVTAKDGGK